MNVVRDQCKLKELDYNLYHCLPVYIYFLNKIKDKYLSLIKFYIQK